MFYKTKKIGGKYFFKHDYLFRTKELKKNKFLQKIKYVRKTQSLYILGATSTVRVFPLKKCW